MKLPVILYILMLIQATSSYADSPANPTPYVKASDYGPYYFTMIPGKYHYENGERIEEIPAYGKAYLLLNDGTSHEKWKVEGWYAFQVFLSNDGRYLVRMGNWAVGHEPANDDLAVAFYRDGVFIKSYSTMDLIKDKTSVDRTMSHYFWRSKDNSYPKLEYSNEFYLKTIENIVYVFDVTTGGITKP